MRRTTLLVALTAMSLPALASPAQAADFSCRASAVRITTVSPPGLTAEPILANTGTTPCSTQDASLLAETTNGPLTLSAGRAHTVRDGGGVGALASITKPKVVLGPLTVQATALETSAALGCTGDPITQSRFTELVVNGQTIAVPAGNAPFNLDLGPLGSVAVNEEIKAGTTVTRRALRVTTPVAEAVFAEIVIGRDGDPCASGGPGGPSGPGGGTGNNGAGSAPNPCPRGATYDSSRNLCVIRESNGNVIVVGAPYSGPGGGTVLALTEARKRFKSRCLFVKGPAYAVIGTNGRDSITGTNRADRILLLRGSDRAEGGRGDDCIDGGSGSDTMSGALGLDRLIGRTGNDHLVGGSHADRLEAGAGADTINSGFGKDRVSGGSGNDRINVATAGPAARSLSCGSGTDKIRVNRNERRLVRGCERIYVIR